ncbi:MAG: MFS transporter [Clostridiales bacterium]|jgi:OFA family oxalate/formate antiporter-like MFS transporter|nr:MFS transporter [Clostridiales bacterium]
MAASVTQNRKKPDEQGRSGSESAKRDFRQGMKVLVTGSFLQLLLGILYVWSVFVQPVSAEFGWSAEGAKLTSSFMLSFFVVGILTGGKLLAVMRSERIVLLGGLMLGSGMLITAFLPKELAWAIYITYGIIGGFGVGAAYNAIISAAQKWFPQNRGFATGISVCAFGFSTVLFAPLIEALIGRFGLRNTFVILGAVFVIAVAALFRFIKMPGESGAAGGASSELMQKKQFTVLQAVKTKEFYFLTLSLMFATAAYFILNPSFKTLAAERGLGEAFGTAVVMLTGVANALGRLGTPLLSDKIGREKATMTIILATAVCAVLLSFVNGFLFIAAIAVIAFCYGGYSGIYPVLTADYFGIKNVGSNYGAVMVGFALSALTFPMAAGLITDVAVKFIALGVLAAMGAALVVMLMKSKLKG